MSAGRKIIACAGIAAILTGGCKKSADTHATDAVITGYDYRKCSCCGGLMISFSNDPQPYHNSFYLIRHLPDNAGIGEQTTFPVYAKVIWQPVTGGCGQSIDIISISKK